jgi:hypothetical protein
MVTGAAPALFGAAGWRQARFIATGATGRFCASVQKSGAAISRAGRRSWLDCRPSRVQPPARPHACPPGGHLRPKLPPHRAAARVVGISSMSQHEARPEQSIPPGRRYRSDCGVRAGPSGRSPWAELKLYPGRSDAHPVPDSLRMSYLPIGWAATRRIGPFGRRCIPIRAETTPGAVGPAAGRWVD